MNEYYAADPVCIESASDLKHLLEKFGPETGRYLRTYPTDWLSRVELSIVAFGSLAHERYKTITRRAKEKKRLLCGNFPYNPDDPWVDNVTRELKKVPQRINRAISTQRYDQKNIEAFAEIELPPTAEERIEGIEEEYARVSDLLLRGSHELVFVDPYLNPCVKDIQRVLVKLLKVAATGKAQKISFIARHDKVIGIKLFDEVEVLDQLKVLKTQSNLNSSCQLSLDLYDDCRAIEKMHPRYLLSVWGGIRFDQGFARLGKGRRVDVSPVSEVIHEELVRLYIEGENDMKLIKRIVV